MIKQLSKVIRVSWRDWGLLAEIVVLLGLARLAIAFVPFRRITRVLGSIGVETSESQDQVEAARAQRIGRLIRGAANNLPWECKCLAQAMVGKVMLTRRNISSTIYIGVCADEDAEFAAHAWLRCGLVYVSGGQNTSKQFTKLASFGDQRS